MKTFSETTRKNIIACIIAPFSVFPAIFALYLVLFLYAVVAKSSVSTTGFEVGFLVAFIGWVMALFLTLAYGLPTALILQRYQRFNLKMLVPFSLVPTYVISVATDAEFGVLLIYAYCSVIVAAAYWYMFNKRINVL
ncbi:hypothetical protein [Pseudoalteromonas sp.]|uniref:hypothetical protein n=1 Tax=Pseudoalteromonas sp. TaxID=53249 RepID=UPI00300270C0